MSGDLSGYAPQGYYDPITRPDGEIVDHDDPRPTAPTLDDLYQALFAALDDHDDDCIYRCLRAACGEPHSCSRSDHPGDNWP